MPEMTIHVGDEPWTIHVDSVDHNGVPLRTGIRVQRQSNWKPYSIEIFVDEKSVAKLDSEQIAYLKA
jgi:hypothetical protein